MEKLKKEKIELEIQNQELSSRTRIPETKEEIVINKEFVDLLAYLSEINKVKKFQI
jgi:hypothetical protein